MTFFRLYYLGLNIQKIYSEVENIDMLYHCQFGTSLSIVKYIVINKVVKNDLVSVNVWN